MIKSALYLDAFRWVHGLADAGAGGRRRRSGTHVHEHVGRLEDRRIPSCIHYHIQGSALLDDHERSINMVSPSILGKRNQA